MVALLIAGIVTLVAVVFSPRLRARLSRPLWEPPESGGAAAQPAPPSQPASEAGAVVPPVPHIVDEDTWARYEAAGYPAVWEAS